MPLWDIHTPVDFFSPTEKHSLAQSITKIYSMLPTFYVRVRFTELPADSYFTGGKPESNFVHLQIWHLARQLHGTEQRQGFLRKVDEVLNPVMEAKGCDWEYTIDESPMDMWKLNGITPPEANSAMEKEWKRADRPVKEAGKM
ncbi:uncharacterized protein LTR77_000927 [Saxophila tyrrhenica]|uniref:Tautomerase cis-CaaD-like domain-containing protein n=1 Tax=Saxophila tyrrhenica TaxID=1690608 RepID=A0AAV9PPR1_9PEZI|nr:hypothetical protein LTR77_000927 [Saxophila tyrrhenica]